MIRALSTSPKVGEQAFSGSAMAVIKMMQRLRRMSLLEARSRLAQKLRVGRERMALARNGLYSKPPSWEHFWNPSTVADPELRSALRRADSTAEPLLTEYLLSRKSPSFYFSHDETIAIVQAFRQAFPDRSQQIVEEAQRLRAHCLKIFAYPEVHCGTHIPWRRDCIHGVESGIQHWSQIPFLNFSKVGDSKIVWEPNRHQHLITLALGYRLTGDETYAEECFSQLENWQRENPYLRGINWASSLELAFRAWSWIWMIQLLTGSSAMTGRRLGELTAALALHADSIAENLSTFYSPNTHLLGEGFALFVIGLLFPELRHSEIHRETGRKILLQEITRQVRQDGSHAEQSTSYHRYATDFFLYAAILADRNQYPFPRSYRDSVERMLDFMVHTAWPDGNHPMIGDADGGRVLPFAARDSNDHRSTLSTAAVYFEREDFRDRAGQFREETLWLLGPEAAVRFQELTPKPPLGTSSVFPDSGLVVMRTDWQNGANMLLFDSGPQGLGGCGHGHADALSVVCSAQGTNWLVDPGTFVYTASHEWREYFRSTQAHNTLVVDGQGQAEPLETFKWVHPCEARLDGWATLPNFDYASGWHGGYTRLTEPVIHRRRVIFIKPDQWFLLDDVTGAGNHSLEFYFHYPPDVRLRVEEQRCWASNGDNRFLVMTDPRVSLETSFGEESRLQGWYSVDYGHRQAAHVLTGKIRCSLPAQFPWVLWPGAPDGARLVRVSDYGSGWTLETDAQVEHFIVSDGIRKQSDQQTGTDADFVFLRQDRLGQALQMMLLNGSWMNQQGTPTFRTQGRVEKFELARQGGLLEIRMRPVLPLTLALGEVTSVRLNGELVRFKHTDNEITVREGS
jgi:hypothetical protein